MPLDRDGLARRACDAFACRFDSPPDVVAHAPGRINLIGEHTDYNDGFVLPMAIDRGIVVAAAARPDGPSRIVSQTLGQSAHVPPAPPTAPIESIEPFARYVIGTASLLGERGRAVPAVDVLIDATLSPGGGLSSSAALTVANCMAFERLSGIALDGHDRARLCQRVEHEWVGTPCGVMDPLACVYGLAHHAMRIDCRTLSMQYVPLPSSDAMTWLIVDSGERHSLAETAYAARRRACRSAAAGLGVAALRDATGDDLARAWLAPTPRDRAQHVIEENQRVDQCVAALAHGDWPALGAMMAASHDSLRTLYDVSCPALDVIVDAAGALIGRGVIGARMTGGGFGGCVIVACHGAAAEAVTADLARSFGRDRIQSVIAADGASILC